MMDKDYNYSEYMTTCIIRIANNFNTIDFDRDNSMDYFVNKEAFYVKIENESFSAHKTIPLDFCYQNEDEQVDSLYIEDFLDELYQMYEAACTPTDDNTLVYSAIIDFLRGINPYQMLDVSEKDKKVTQLALILPVKYWSEVFIEEILRPACIQAGWISKDDDYSKLIFSNELQCRMIYLQNEKKVLTWDTNNSILRERKYISCSIQCVPHKAMVLLSLELFQMQYDTDFVRACTSNRSQLRDAFYSPTHIGSTTTIELPLPSLTDMLDSLKAFLAATLSEPLDMDDNLLQTLLYSLTINLYHYSQKDAPLDPHLIDLANQYGHRVITQAQIELLSSLTTHDVLNYLPDVMGFDIYKYVDEYLQENQLMDENFAGVFIHTESNIMKTSQCGGFQLYTDPESEYLDHQMGYAAALYLEKIQQKVKDVMTDSQRFIGFVHTSKSMWPMTEYGLRYKIYKMVELASKLMQPRVTGQVTDNTIMPPTSNIDKFLQDLPPYSFYAEAKITKHQTIKLLLHQVICTDSVDEAIEKSTLAIDQVSMEFDDIFTSICDSMWLLIEDGTLMADSCDLHCADTDSHMQNYTYFCEQLSKQLREIFTSATQGGQSLDDVIHIQYHPACQDCSILLTQRMILDQGLKPYLDSISTNILAGIQSKASFGDHKIVRLLITGSMLATWMEESFNHLYQNYVWKQLEEDLLLGIHSRQLRVNLVMQRSDVLDDHFFNDDCFSQRQLFQQVSSKSYYLEMICSGPTSAEIYTIDQDATYTRLNTIATSGLKTWRLLLTQSELDVLDKEGISKTVYFSFKRQADGQIKLEDEGYPIIYILVLIAIPFSISQEQLDDPSWTSPTENAVLINLLESLPSLQALSNQTTFPMTIHVKPCRNSSKLELATRLGVGSAGADDPLGLRKVYVSERLTLKQILI